MRRCRDRKRIPDYSVTGVPAYAIHLKSIEIGDENGCLCGSHCLGQICSEVHNKTGDFDPRRERRIKTSGIPRLGIPLVYLIHRKRLVCIRSLRRESCSRGRNMSSVSSVALKRGLALLNTRPCKILKFISAQYLWISEIQKVLLTIWHVTIHQGIPQLNHLVLVWIASWFLQLYKV